MTAKSILEAAMKLSKTEKRRLARRLEESAAEEDLLIAGAKEAELTLQAYERGEIGGKPVDEVMRRLLKRKPKKK